MHLSPSFSEALVYAAEVHAGQVRKGTEIPYVSHLLAVASLVLEHGGTEEEAIGALLHDAAEDAGGEQRLREITARFGPNVAQIVADCSDTFETPKPPWRARKEAYIAHVESTSASVRLVSAADKLHNARSILGDYRVRGEDLWSRFNGGRDGTLWYYRALTDAFQKAGASSLTAELDRTVSGLETLVSSVPAQTTADGDPLLLKQ